MNQSKTKTPFDKETLQHFKELLLNKRAEAHEEVNKIEASLSDLKEADDADFSSIAHHMGDMGSDVEQEEMINQLLEREKKYIRQINEALERIEEGTYGICLATGKPIPRERLEAVPHTRYSIEAKQQGLVRDS